MTELEEEERSIEKRLAERVAVKLPLVPSLPFPSSLSPLPVRTGEGAREELRGETALRRLE